MTGLGVVYGVCGDALDAKNQNIRLAIESVDLRADESCRAHRVAAEAEIAEAQGMGISGTPSFVVGLTDTSDSVAVRVTEYIRGAQALPAFQSAIDGLLKEATPAKSDKKDS